MSGVVAAVVVGAVQGAAAETGVPAPPLCRRSSADAWFPFRFRLVSCGALCRLRLVFSFGGGGRPLVWCLGRNVLVVVAVAVVDEAVVVAAKVEIRPLVVVCFAAE